jgi:hypothetical protein
MGLGCQRGKSTVPTLASPLVAKGVLAVREERAPYNQLNPTRRILELSRQPVNNRHDHIRLVLPDPVPGGLAESMVGGRVYG